MSVFFTRRGKAPYRPELFDNFADNYWENIIWACQTKNVPESWTVGSQKPMPINGTDYPIDIIGLGHDDYADGSGKAPITFQMHDCYATGYRMNATDTNVGGWASCEMRTVTLPTILSLMPKEVQDAIREVNKLSSAGGGDGSLVTTADKLFLLSYIETTKTNHPFITNKEGTHYENYYVNDNARKKNFAGSVGAWWLRSTAERYTNNFFDMLTTGGGSVSPASNTGLGVAFAFCF